MRPVFVIHDSPFLHECLRLQGKTQLGTTIRRRYHSPVTPALDSILRVESGHYYSK
jgi:hypothetical protein